MEMTASAMFGARRRPVHPSASSASCRWTKCASVRVPSSTLRPRWTASAPSACCSSRQHAGDKTDLVDRVGNVLGGPLAGVFSESHQHVPRSTVVGASACRSRGGCRLPGQLRRSSPSTRPSWWRFCSPPGWRTRTGWTRFISARSRGARVPRAADVTMPHIAISTTLSAGEFTLWARDRRRAWRQGRLRAPGMTPRVVILDPELSRETPASLWGSTGLKAFDHAVETISSLKPQPFADALALRRSGC